MHSQPLSQPLGSHLAAWNKVSMSWTIWEAGLKTVFFIKGQSSCLLFLASLDHNNATAGTSHNPPQGVDSTPLIYKHTHTHTPSKAKSDRMHVLHNSNLAK